MKRRYAHPCAACGNYDFTFYEEYHECIEYQWVCDSCGTQMSITFQKNGEVAVQIPTGRRCERTLALIRLVNAPKIMFIVRSVAWDGDINNASYFNNTCPSNIVRCEEIIDNGETDPHGCFELLQEICITGPRGQDRDEVMTILTDLAEAVTSAYKEDS